MLGVRVLSATTVTTRYFQTDNLGGTYCLQGSLDVGDH
jgi:hypothetical protein